MAQDDIQGVVTDENGNPVQGATVTLWLNEGIDRSGFARDSSTAIYTLTDSNGEYQFNQHPQGDGSTQEWHLAVRFDDGSGDFNSLSLPYVTADLPKGDVIPDSRVSRWKFDEGSGSTAADSWDNNDGTVNGATWTTDSQQGGYALSFDGTDDVVDVPNNSNLEPDNVSVSVWIKTSGSAGDYIYKKEVGSTFNKINLISDNTVRATMSAGGGTVDLDSTTSVGDGSYHHICMTYDGSEFELFIDGSSKATDTSLSGPCDYTQENIIIGNNGFSNSFSGIIDDLRLYNKGLSDTEVSNLYSRGSIS